LFHKANFFGSCIIHILYTECAEIIKDNAGAKGLRMGGSWTPLPQVLYFVHKINFTLLYLFIQPQNSSAFSKLPETIKKQPAARKRGL